MKLILDILYRPLRMNIFGKIVITLAILILIVISLALATILTKRTMPHEEWQTLNHEGYGFSIDYPATWSADQYGDSGWRGMEYARAQLIGSGSYVFINQQTMKQPTLTEAFEWGQDIIHRRRIVDIASPVETQIGYGDYSALIQTYKEDVFIGTTYTKAVYIATDNSVFLIQFFDLNEKSEPVSDQMLTSFRLFDGGKN